MDGDDDDEDDDDDGDDDDNDDEEEKILTCFPSLPCTEAEGNSLMNRIP